MVSRRHVLATTGVVAASSGCLSVLGNDGENPTGGGNELGSAGGGAGVRLGRLAVENNHDAAHDVQVAVENADGMLHLGSYALEAGGASRVIEGDWNTTPGEYLIHARLDDREIRTADVTEGVSDDVACVRVLLRIGAEGRLSIWNGADCRR